MAPNANHADLDDAIDSKIEFMKRVNPKLKEKKTKFAKPEEVALSPSKTKSMKGGLANKKLAKQMTKMVNDELGAIDKKAADRHDHSNGHLVNYFEEIGWCDPYPQTEVDAKKAYEVNIMHLTMNKMAYCSSRYLEGVPPTIIYYPSDYLLKKMYKLMAANSGKTDHDDIIEALGIIEDPLKEQMEEEIAACTAHHH